jgi:hypothetical protein
MAILSGVQWDPVYPQPPKMKNGVRRFAFHTIVGADDPRKQATLTCLWNGHRKQHRHTDAVAAATGAANYDTASAETADRGTGFPDWNINDPKQVPPWRDEQLEALIDTTVQFHRIHSIPLELLPDSKAGRKGFGYHRLGIRGDFLGSGYIYPGWVPGGETWSSSVGKACPGDRRIKQVIEIILPEARRRVNPPPSPPIPEEPPMPTAEEIAAAVARHPDQISVYNNIRFLREDLEEVRVTVLDGFTKIEEILANDRIDMSTKLHRISDVIYTTTGQAAWADLLCHSWEDLQTARWGQLGKALEVARPPV